MNGAYIHCKFQTENTKDLLDLPTFIKSSIRTKYIGKCFKGQYVTDIAEFIEEDEYMVKNLIVLDKCFMQVESKFKPSIFKLPNLSILVNCVVTEIKDKGLTAILEFVGDTPQKHKFKCKIIAEIGESVINTITTTGIKTNIQVSGVYYYPFLDSINVEGRIIGEPILGIFATFDVSKINQDSWKMFGMLQETLSKFSAGQKQELYTRAKSIFVDVDNYYLPINKSKKVVITYKDGKMAGATGTPIDTGNGKSQVVYVDMINPETLTLYIIREWTADVSVDGLGAHVADQDTTIGTQTVFINYINWLNTLINSVYVSHNTT